MPKQQRDLRHAGDRIEQLLGELESVADPRLRARATEIVRLIVELYGAALERVLDLAADQGDASNALRRRMAEDELLSSLLIVHGLHPLSLEQRIEDALDGVRPYLGSHGGDVELLEVSDGGVVRLRLLGSCDGCPSSSMTLKLAVEGAIEAAAPEIAGIEVEGVEAPQATPAASGLIPLDSLRRRPADAPAGQKVPKAPQGAPLQAAPPRAAAQGARTGPAWEALPPVDDLAVSEVRGLEVAGVDLVLCRAGQGLYAYRDACAACGESLVGARLEDVELTCGGCGARYDVAQAGMGLDDGAVHLEPLPLLRREGRFEVAVPAVVS